MNRREKRERIRALIRKGIRERDHDGLAHVIDEITSYISNPKELGRQLEGILERLPDRLVDVMLIHTETMFGIPWGDEKKVEEATGGHGGDALDAYVAKKLGIKWEVAQ